MSKTKKGYVEVLEQNLFRPLNSITLSEFSEGAGNEPEGKMKALHSSSALVCNVFDYWRCKNLDTISTACGIPVGYKCLSFERTFRTRLKGTPPHLDVAFHGETESMAVIESKFTEIYEKSKKDPRISLEKYVKPKRRWEEMGLPQCDRLAYDIYQKKDPFEYLDAIQLLKHILGLKTQLYKNDFSLTYLWYEIPGDEAKKHREEVEFFLQKVKNEIKLFRLTYQELFDNLRRLTEGNMLHSRYMEYLESRYFSNESH